MPTTDPFPVPTRTERRGQFPDHFDPVRAALLPLAQARELARARLARWRADHE